MSDFELDFCESGSALGRPALFVSSHPKILQIRCQFMFYVTSENTGPDQVETSSKKGKLWILILFEVLGARESAVAADVCLSAHLD